MWCFRHRFIAGWSWPFCSMTATSNLWPMQVAYTGWWNGLVLGLWNDSLQVCEKILTGLTCQCAALLLLLTESSVYCGIRFGPYPAFGLQPGLLHWLVGWFWQFLLELMWIRLVIVQGRFCRLFIALIFYPCPHVGCFWPCRFWEGNDLAKNTWRELDKAHKQMAKSGIWSIMDK